MKRHDRAIKAPLGYLLIILVSGLSSPSTVHGQDQRGRALSRGQDQRGRALSRGQDREVTDTMGNPYLSNTLPSTGHPTRFRRFTTGHHQQSAATTSLAGRRGRSAVSPYIRLAGPGDPATNYFLGVQRDQQIYDTAAQTRSIDRELSGIRQDFQTRTPEVTRFGPLETEGTTPLQRSLRQQEINYQQSLVEQSLRELKRSQTESSEQERELLREMLNELKAIRQDLKKPDEELPEDLKKPGEGAPKGQQDPVPQE